MYLLHYLITKMFISKNLKNFPIFMIFQIDLYDFNFIYMKRIGLFYHKCLHQILAISYSYSFIYINKINL